MTRLRFVSGVTVPAATFGSSTFGGPITWGQSASDPIAGLEFAAFPWPDGYPVAMSWRYRVGDTAPDLQVIVASPDGPIDPAPIGSATLVLDRYGDIEPHQIALDLAIEVDRFRRRLRTGDLDDPGTYRGVVRLVMLSGRSMTVPVDDRVTFRITERHDEDAAV